MAYVKNTWRDQEVERPKTYEMTNNTDGSVTLTDSFGLVSELGTPVNADNMNHIEEGIAGCDLRKHNLTETYEKGEWVTGVIDDVKGIYESLISNNYGNPLTDDTKWQKVELGGGGTGGLNMFDRVRKDHVLSFEESKGLALLGTYVYKTGVAGERYGYPEFVAKCIDEKADAAATQITLGENTVTMYVNSNGHIFYDIADKAAVDAWFDTWGVAWFYGVDEENERIFLPRNTKYFKNGTTDNVGSMQEAAAPNIKGETSQIPTGWTNTSWAATGAFYKTGEMANSGAGGNSGVYAWKLGLDASKSSSVYKDSATTLDVDSTNLLVYMVVGNTEQQSAITDVVDITTSENDTIPLGFSIYQGGNVQPSVAWLASNGQWNSGTMYETFYNHYVLLIGQPFAGGHVKASTDDYDDYDLVINQDEQIFRLPLRNGQEGMFSTPVVGSGLTLGLTNGKGTNAGIYYNTNQNSIYPSANAYGNAIPSNASESSPFSNTTVLGVTSDPDKSGLIADIKNVQIPEGWQLYFKVGNAVQNQELIDIAEVTTELTTKLSINDKAAIVDWGMPDYKNGTVITVANTYYPVENGGELRYLTINSAPNTITIQYPDNNTMSFTTGVTSTYGAIYGFVRIPAGCSVKISQILSSNYPQVIYPLVGGN